MHTKFVTDERADTWTNGWYEKMPILLFYIVISLNFDTNICFTLLYFTRQMWLHRSKVSRFGNSVATIDGRKSNDQEQSHSAESATAPESW